MAKKDREANRGARAAEIQAQAARKERNRKALIAAAVVVVLSAIVAAGVIFTSGDGGSDTANGPSEMPKAVASGPALVVGDDPTATKVVIYEDFLCPACREFEDATRDFLQVDAAEGRALVEYRPFKLLPQEYSTLALSAWGAVLEGGTGEQALKYHDLLFDNQPYESAADDPEVDELVELAEEAGVTDQAVLDAIGEPNPAFVQAANDAATEAGITGTPTVFVDGEELQGSSLTEMADRLQTRLAQD